MNSAKIIGITKPHGIWMDHLKADDLVALAQQHVKRIGIDQKIDGWLIKGVTKI